MSFCVRSWSVTRSRRVGFAPPKKTHTRIEEASSMSQGARFLTCLGLN